MEKKAEDEIWLKVLCSLITVTKDTENTESSMLRTFDYVKNVSDSLMK